MMRRTLLDCESAVGYNLQGRRRPELEESMPRKHLRDDLPKICEVVVDVDLPAGIRVED